jgi:L-aspartate oxidase
LLNKIKNIKIEAAPEYEYDLDNYRTLNKKVLINTIYKLRGDIKNELVTC